jgi:hypothetical protein
MHSPIIGRGHDAPAIGYRFAEQTSKGNLWRGIGLGDRLFDLDNTAATHRILPAARAIARDPEAALLKPQKRGICCGNAGAKPWRSSAALQHPPDSERSCARA